MPQQLSPISSFSFTEHKLGKKWVDGKDIYEKTVDLGNLPNSSNKTVNHNIVYDKIISYSAFAQNSEGTIIHMPLYVSGNNYVLISIKSQYVELNTNTDRSEYYAYITIQYTKTQEA